MTDEDNVPVSITRNQPETLSLRDYFAGQALVGAITGYASVDDPTIARRCYELADAMLEERAR